MDKQHRIGEFKDEWLKLKQNIAFNIGRYVRDYYENLQISCDVLGFTELSGVVKYLISVIEEDSDNRGIRLLKGVVEEGRNYNDKVDFFDGFSSFNKLYDDAYKWILGARIKKLLSDKQEAYFPVPGIISNLGKQYDLTSCELCIISIHYLLEEWSSFARIMRDVSTFDYIKIISGLCTMKSDMYASLIRRDGRLYKKGLIRSSPLQHASFSNISLGRPLMFALNSGDLEHISSGLFRAKRRVKYQIHQFAIPPLETDFILGVLKMKKAVLISGESGVGKTEFAYTIADIMKRSIQNLSMDSFHFSNSSNRAAAEDKLMMIRTASHLLNKDKDLLLIDEADTVLRSAAGFFGLLGSDGSYDKGELNAVIEEMDVPSVWITNSIDMIPPSALRRFAYVYEFPRPGMRMRKSMLEQKLQVSNKSNISELTDRVSKHFDLTPSAMERMVNVVSALDGSNKFTGGSSFLDVFEIYLDNVSRGPLGHDFRRLTSVSESFNPELISSSLPLGELIKRVQKRTRLGKSSRILFEGPPGGGKTQFSLYFASSIGREAVVKKPSDLLSKWVGETEKNINAMFREAELSGSVLIIDEADALLADRSKARQLWDLTQTSEFLQWIQEFKGILIACTNRAECIDPAIRRRFHQKITFGPLRKDMINTALKHMFPNINFTSEIMELIKKGPPLMLSDIANVSEMFDTEEELGAEVIINEILENAKSRDMSLKIGFK